MNHRLHQKVKFIDILKKKLLQTRNNTLVHITNGR